MLTAVAALAVAAPVAGAAERPERGKVAFSGKRGDSRVIYTRNQDGTGLRRLRTAGRADRPAWSPRGKRLAFTRYGSLGAQVWIVYGNGIGLRALTSGPSDGMPAWAPSEEALAFARGSRRRRDVYTVTADGVKLRRLTKRRTDDHSPSWSVKGRIAFVRRNRRSDDLYWAPQQGGRARRLTRSPRHDSNPAWSPTGRTLVYSHGRSGKRDLYLLSASGKRRRRLTALRGDELEPAWSPDGKRLVFVHRRKGNRRVYILKPSGKPIRRLTRTRRVRRFTSSRSASRNPTWQPAGLDPVIAAAGDIACDPNFRYFNNGNGVGGACRQKLTSDVLLRMDLDSVLLPGDIQYEDGKLAKFQASFHPSWGRLKALMRPAPGNHEYRDPGAAGYFDYFNGVGRQTGRAGDRRSGYYSFDVGDWHVLALNSECDFVGGCHATSPQLQWLRADLARNPRRCTLAMFHRPRFTSGRHSAEGEMLPIWSALYQSGADVIVNGHEHFYERFAPQNPSGGYDAGRGIRQFVAGMGGRNFHGYEEIAPNSEVRNNRTFGVLRLKLGDGGYDWELVGTSGRRADRGSSACH